MYAECTYFCTIARNFNSISRDHNQPIKRPEFNEVLYNLYIYNRNIPREKSFALDGKQISFFNRLDFNAKSLNGGILVFIHCQGNPYYEIRNCITISIVYPYYIHTIYIFILHSKKIAISMKIGFPYYFHRKDFEKNFQ
jgi:hypothetical protein